MPEEKKVEIACYGCKAEDFCVRCASTEGCEHCEDVCGECDPRSGVSACPKKFRWREWQHGGASVFTKKKLMRKTVTRKIPSCKWVIEDLCSDCQAKCAQVELPPGVEVPAPPKLAKAKLLKPRSAVVPASATRTTELVPAELSENGTRSVPR